MKIIRLITFLVFAAFSALVVNAQVMYHPKLQDGNVDMVKERADITEILRNSSQIHMYCNDGTIAFTKDVLFLEDRVEVTPKKNRYFSVKSVVVSFSDIMDSPVKVQKINIFNVDYFGVIPIKACQSYFLFSDLEMAKKYADFLFLLQHQLNEKRYTSKLVLFKPIAAKYRALKEKPLVSEEQRKYIVQANSSVQQHQYIGAVELFNKAIELDPTAYPAAYSNLALLSAQISNFYAAIYYMKKYLLLVPDASDARSGQDKIYEWELSITK